MRSISQLVSEGFIWGVGITRPRQGRERSAAFYITGVLVATLCFVASMFFFLKSFIY